MRRKLLTGLAAGFGLLAAGTAVGAWREANFGRGPQDGSGAPNGAIEVAIVANAVAGTVSFIDLETGQVRKTLDVTPDGKTVGLLRNPSQYFAQSKAEGYGGKNYAQDTDLSRDGRILYVSRGFLDDVAAFDIRSGDLLWRATIPGVRSDHMALSPDGKRLFVAAEIEGGNVVQALDAASGKKLRTVRVGQWPHDIHFSRSHPWAYVASLGDMFKPVAERGKASDAYTVTRLHSETMKPLRTYNFEEGVRPFAVTHDDRFLYAQLSNQHNVVKQDLTSGKRAAKLELPVKAGVTKDDWDFEAPHHGLALSKDERTLCLAGRASDYAALVDTTTMTLRKIIPVGDAPSWATISKGDRFCVVASTRSDDVSVIDLIAAQEVHRIKVGRGPKHITIGAAVL